MSVAFDDPSLLRRILGIVEEGLRHSRGGLLLQLAVPRREAGSQSCRAVAGAWREAEVRTARNLWEAPAAGSGVRNSSERQGR
jgi:hypothetical protein